MQPTESNEEEHEIVFNDDDDDDDDKSFSVGRRNRTSTTNSTSISSSRNIRSHVAETHQSPSIQHFQPFADENMDEAVQAAIRLESFLTSSITPSSSSSSSIVPPPPPPPIGTYQPYMINQTKFNHPYLVAVATPNHMLARSQFFITTVKAQWLSGQYTIFGMILSGTEFIQEIEQYGTYGGQPTTTITIVDCNELPLRPEDKKPHY